MFDSTHMNLGTKDMDMGPIPFDPNDHTTFSQSALHNLFYWFHCHNHPHFTAFASFHYGQLPGYKAGFCMQSVAREINSRYVSFNNPFAFCTHQGIAAGWSDTCRF
jgi:hypothetical protein